MEAEILNICLLAFCHFVAVIDHSLLMGRVFNKCQLNKKMCETGSSSLCLGSNTHCLCCRQNMKTKEISPMGCIQLAWKKFKTLWRMDLHLSITEDMEKYSCWLLQESYTAVEDPVSFNRLWIHYWLTWLTSSCIKVPDASETLLHFFPAYRWRDKVCRKVIPA